MGGCGQCNWQCHVSMAAPRPTHATPGYLNALDWVLFEPGPLRLVGVAPLPPVSELLRDTALPSAEYPSDHVSLCADLEWTE